MTSIHTKLGVFALLAGERDERKRPDTHRGKKENFCLRAHDGLMCCMLRATKSFFYIEVIQHLLRDA